MPKGDGWPFFIEFATRGRTGSLNPAEFPPPGQGEVYNDDIATPHYIAPLRDYAYKQSKWIAEEHPLAISRAEHAHGGS